MLDLSANQIEGMPPRLAAALPALVELVLDENHLRALGDELSGLPKLKKLSARSNRVAAVDPFSGEQVGGSGCSSSPCKLSCRAGVALGVFRPFLFSREEFCFQHERSGVPAAAAFCLKQRWMEVVGRA